MLQAALEQALLSASPGESFFTGGGVHTFNNFVARTTAASPTVREVLQARSTCPSCGIMRDVVRHTIYQGPGTTSPGSSRTGTTRGGRNTSPASPTGKARFTCAASGTSTAARSPTRSAKTCSTTCAPAWTASPRCSFTCRRRPRPRRSASSGKSASTARSSQSRTSIQALRPQRPRGLRSGRPGLRGTHPPAAAVARRLPAEEARRQLGRRGQGQHEERQAVLTAGCSAPATRAARIPASTPCWSSRPLVDIHRRWARVGYPSATWCPRSPPRWAARATGRRRSPS